MDPITALVTGTVSALMLLINKSTEEFAGAAGKAAFDKAKGLLATLKANWSGDKEATENLIQFEREPERYRRVMENTLKEKLSKNKDLADELTQILEEMGPTLEVIQEMKEAKQITGLAAREVNTGRMKVRQEIEKGENVTGMKIDRLGRIRNGK